MVQCTRYCDWLNIFVENPFDLRKNGEKNIRFCKAKNAEKSLINRRKKGNITNIIKCYRCRNLWDICTIRMLENGRHEEESKRTVNRSS